MEPLSPKPSEEPSEAPPAPEAPPAAPASSGAPLPEVAPPSEPAPSGPAAAGADDAPEQTPTAGPAESAPAGPARRRPRGRTSLIVASAALLGVVAGVATGYTIQADRKPTPLAPLSQAKLTYPEEYVPEDEWEPVPAKHDRRVKTDGDLRKLLVDKPKSALKGGLYAITDGWVSVSSFARQFEEPGRMFSNLLSEDVRRIAATQWESGEHKVTYVQLVQFHELSHRAAPAHAQGQQSYMPRDDFAGNAGHPIKGSSNGRYYVDDSPERRPGYLPVYAARAIVQRGDIVVDIHIMDTEPVGEKEIRELTQRQMERL